MAIIREKMLAMLANIKEMREMMRKSGQKGILGVIHEKGPIDFKTLTREIPNTSSRTLRRKIERLLDEGKIIKHKEGREVMYSASA